MCNLYTCVFLDMQKGRVIQSTGSWYKVKTQVSLVQSRLSGKFRLDEKEVTNPIAVGDWVDISINEDETGIIKYIHERSNYITRKATHGRKGEHILVSNINRAFVVQSVHKPKIKEGFIDRFLVTCEAYEVTPSIIINKMDLAQKNDGSYTKELKKLYESLGYAVFLTNALDSESLVQLREVIKGNTTCFIGPSGVGKTSLLNAIDPQYSEKIGEISNYSNKGKHTTTFAKLIEIENGGFIVDTPGIREFGLVNIKPWELSLYFPEMLEARTLCKFNNCTHIHEPGCKVIAACEEGKIDTRRYHSYINMLKSIQ